jgi:hypothetical protein
MTTAFLPDALTTSKPIRLDTLILLAVGAFVLWSLIAMRDVRDNRRDRHR